MIGISGGLPARYVLGAAQNRNWRANLVQQIGILAAFRRPRVPSSASHGSCRYSARASAISICRKTIIDRSSHADYQDLTSKVYETASLDFTPHEN
jgi:hypothetical protein